MKRFLLLGVCIAFSIFSHAQSQRLELVEEFTGENCNPCAAYNPAFNALLDANQSKIISLKYQSNIPYVPPSSYPPMYNQTQKDVDTRLNYYKVPSAPWCTLDGNKFNSNVHGFTQSFINTESVITSPFDISVTHSISHNYDSIYITMVVTASSDIASSKHYRAHIVLAEKEITFTSSPGSNGEKDFSMVVRKMYPDAKGSHMDTSWVSGQSDTFKIAALIPSYIYEISQVCVVGFVQDSVGKNIKQAAISQPVPVDLNEGITWVSAPLVNCTGAFLPSVVLKNKGASKIDSCIVSYNVDGGTAVTKTLITAIASGTSKTIQLDSIHEAPGKHTLTVTCSMPNGLIDWSKDNSYSSITNIVGSYAPTPVLEEFAINIFPPTGWFVNDLDRDGIKWTRKTGAGGFGNTTACAGLPLYQSPSGNVDELNLLPLDLSGVTEQYVTFSLAYCGIFGENDDLSVQVSTDCGANWDIVWDKYGPSLATDTNSIYVFTPTNKSWRSESANLKNYVGQGEVLVKFSVLSDQGNYIYLDDINVSTSAVGVNKVDKTETSLNIFPNPANTSENLELSLSKNSDVRISVTNLLGETVFSELKKDMISGNHHFTLDVTKFATGIYNVNVATGSEVSTKKMVIIK